MLVLVDDAQWLDEPSLEAFLFAGRRLGAEGIAMLGALRDGTAGRRVEVPWLERLRIEPLGTRRRARCSRRPGRADRAARSPTGSSTAPAGNPLALLEIPTLLSDGQLAGREPLEEPLRPGTGRARVPARARALPEDARRALLVAAAARAPARST